VAGWDAPADALRRGKASTREGRASGVGCEVGRREPSRTGEEPSDGPPVECRRISDESRIDMGLDRSAVYLERERVDRCASYEDQRAFPVSRSRSAVSDHRLGAPADDDGVLGAGSGGKIDRPVPADEPTRCRGHWAGESHMEEQDVRADLLRDVRLDDVDVGGRCRGDIADRVDDYVGACRRGGRENQRVDSEDRDQQANRSQHSYLPGARARQPSAPHAPDDTPRPKSVGFRRLLGKAFEGPSTPMPPEESREATRPGRRATPLAGAMSGRAWRANSGGTTASPSRERDGVFVCA
jgi:hypothetical protein